MTDSAALKLKRATKRIEELNGFLREKRPFAYILQTDAITGERSTRAKKNTAASDEAALIGGDAVHNIRSALDHAYWDIVHPFARTPKEERAVQFPFCEKAARLEEAVKNRLAHRVSDRFFQTLLNLKPYGEATGNRMLYLIDLLDLPDKHRRLTPTADYTQVSADILKRQIPDFPAGMSGMLGFGANRKGDVAWRARSIDPATLGEAIPPTTHMFEKQLDVPVQIVFEVREWGLLAPMVPTLNKMVEVASQTINIMRLAAPAP